MSSQLLTVIVCPRPVKDAAGLHLRWSWAKLGEDMGFLDKLEDSVKSAEAREQTTESAERERVQRENERARARASAPWAEKLRNAPFTEELLRQVTRIGHGRRTKVHMAWIGIPPYLRLEAREKRLELRPTPEGIVAAFFEGTDEVRSMPVDLDGRAEDLAREWLG